MIYLAIYIFGIVVLLWTVRQRTLKNDLDWGLQAQPDSIRVVLLLGLIPLVNIVLTCFIWLDIYKTFNKETIRRTEVGRKIQNYLDKPLYKKVLFIK